MGFFSFNNFIPAPVLLAFLFSTAMIFIFVQMKLKNEQRKYFQEISNSFDDPALICDNTGNVLFANQTFIYLFGPKLIPVNELLDISDIRKMPLGTDTKLNCRDGKRRDFTIYKLMNRTLAFNEELFVIIIKDSIHLL